ncbi:hypothetical protein CDAR_2161 [Caerostris darwini]|uniref:Uncharacterized protein n=1 Tax=Caerostris darwini TaxID=1538125 RepID=A0AAV4RYD1_9ARAC|nr:hypothetical protein CDAR_2161 [Caerostris darwini]
MISLCRIVKLRRVGIVSSVLLPHVPSDEGRGTIFRQFPRNLKKTYLAGSCCGLIKRFLISFLTQIGPFPGIDSFGLIVKAVRIIGYFSSNIIYGDEHCTTEMTFMLQKNTSSGTKSLWSSEESPQEVVFRHAPCGFFWDYEPAENYNGGSSRKNVVVQPESALPNHIIKRTN